jgi:hypothetical protein
MRTNQKAKGNNQKSRIRVCAIRHATAGSRYRAALSLFLICDFCLLIFDLPF